MEMYPLLFLWYRKVVPVRKTLFIMRLLSLFLFVFLFKVNAGGYAQSIRLKVSNVSLIEVFQRIKQQTDFRFIYVRDELQQAKPVSIDVKDASLKEVLDLCFAEQMFTYVIEGTYVIVKRKPVNQSVTTSTIVTHDVTGYVVDEEGEPAAGITVQVKGSTVAVSTNAEGYFQLKAVEPNAVLVFSGVNVEEKSVALKGATELTVRLQRKVNKLDEVQVIAYGSTTKRLNTGSVSKIGSNEIEQQPVLNPVAAIQGRAPGVFVTTQNGLPGGNISVLIRGKGSINSGTEPLFVVDGVPFNSTPLNNSFGSLTTTITGSISPLNSINPSDIESIEILKDADATAIYGSRAANGVVLITTKKAKAGKPKVDVGIYGGVQTLNDFPEMLDLQAYLLLRREGFFNDNLVPTVTNAPDLLVWDTTKHTDWSRYMLGGTAGLISSQISISGGGPLVQFLLSGNYRKEGSILPGKQQYQRGGLHVSLHQQSANHKFNMDFTFSLSADQNRTLSSSIFSILTLPPNFPLYDAAGNTNWTGISDVHPEAVLKRKASNETMNYVGNLQIRYQLFPGLRLKFSAGYTMTDMDQLMLFPKASLNPSSASESYAYYGDLRTKGIVLEPQVEYSFSRKQQRVDVLGGGSWQQNDNRRNLFTGRNYSNEGLLESIGAAGTVTGSNQLSTYKYASAFTRVTYAYRERYILNMQGRLDGSSRFGPGKRTGMFGAVGAAWIFSKERFLQDVAWMSFGKLRGSFGITGNDQIPEYQYLSTYRNSSVLYQGVAGLTPSRIANAAFGWESNQKTELALETGFLNNRLLLTAAYYHQLSGNQLIDYPLPYMSGPFGSYLANLPAKVLNYGWEFEFSGTVLQKEAMQVQVHGNISLPKNKLLSYPGLAASSFANTYVEGEDISIRKGLKYLGADVQTGLPRFEDVNGDGVISLPEDYVIIGKVSPICYGGFGCDVRYRQFEVSVFFQYSSQSAQGTSTIPGTRSNKFSTAIDRWTKAGEERWIPKATTVPSGNYSLLSLSDAAFYNASYVRFKTMHVSYRLPEKLLQRMKLGTGRIYAEGQNVFTWRKRGNLYDPETANTGIPPLRTLAAGFQFTF